MFDVKPLIVGVDIFFVISGFVMMHVERGYGMNASISFLRRRIIRVVPLYWILTTVYVASYIHSNGHNGIHLSEVRKFITSYLFWPHANTRFDKEDIAPLYQIGWTLNYEFFFYVIFSVATLLRQSFRIAFIAFIFCFLAVVGQFIDFPLPLFFWSNPIILEFVLGMLLARLYSRGIRARADFLIFMVAALFIAFGFGFAFEDDINLFLAPITRFTHLVLWGIPSTMFVWCMISAQWTFSLKIVQAAMFIGGASYSIYLMHEIIFETISSSLIYMIGNNGTSIVLLTTAISMLLFAIACGCFVHVAIERPLYRCLRSFSNDHRYHG